MKIILATPLFPPETEEIALYSKRFAEGVKIASSGDHSAAVVAYSDFPESVPEVEIISVSKQLMLPVRLVRYFFALRKAATKADVLYVQNSLASGFPAIIVRKMTHIPVIIYFAEDEVLKSETRYIGAKKTFRQRIVFPLQSWILRNANVVMTPHHSLAKSLHMNYKIPKEKIVVVPLPAPQPEILPFPSIPSVPKIVFLSGQAKNECESYLDEIRQNFPDLVFVTLDVRSSRAEKWHHLKNATLCAYAESDNESALLPLALVAEAPRVSVSDEQTAKALILKILHEPLHRETLVVEGRNVLSKLSLKVHIKTFISIADHIR